MKNRNDWRVSPLRTELDILADGRLRLNEPLARHMTARLGGVADALIVAYSADILERAARFAWAHDIPTRIFGAGANVLITDAGYRGLVIINDARESYLHADGGATVDSGVSMIHLARATIDAGLDGFIWAVSVPGTVGGGVVNNAGAHDGTMADSIVSVQVAFPDRATEVWDHTQLAYTYRESALKHRTDSFCVLQVQLQFAPGHDPAALKAEADSFIAQRKRTQPPGASLGSMFKNPPNDYAGRLIEACGLKGTRIGGVEISTVHANFFVNHGDGTARDYLALIALAQRTVQDRFGVDLVLEVEVIGESK